MPSAVKNVSRRVSIGLFLASLGAFGCARAADLRSISRIAFGPENVLFVADWKASRITALQLPKVPPAAVRPYNVRDLGAQLSETAGGAGVHITDMVARPGTGLVYVAYEYGKGQTPALAEVSSQRNDSPN
jgi:hypothetical protein